MIRHISTVSMAPRSSWKEPWLFESLEDAVKFAQITKQLVYACAPGWSLTYEVYPGGRCIGHKPFQAVSA